MFFMNRFENLLFSSVHEQVLLAMRFVLSGVLFKGNSNYQIRKCCVLIGRKFSLVKFQRENAIAVSLLVNGQILEPPSAPRGFDLEQNGYHHSNGREKSHTEIR